jgi:hypothetical protein
MWEEDRYPTSDAAIIAILDRAGKEQSGELIPTRPMGIDMIRTGRDYREGVNKTPEDLMAEFGFRAIQFGNSVTQTERVEWMNEIYDALADFADILGMSRRWIGFNGTLALAVGARGVGGISHSAHFEPNLKVINLTRASGAGSFAHEWGHALDNRLMQLLFPTILYLSTFLSKLGSWVTDGMDERKKLIYAEHLKIMAFCARMSSHTEKSTYLKNAEQIRETRGSKKYWTQPEEMYARAFEAYIQDALTAKGISSPWLVHGTMESDYDMTRIIGMPYPTGRELETMNGHFQAMIEQLRKK